jgi:predicted transglutaminase-like cysteine proteinase
LRHAAIAESEKMAGFGAHKALLAIILMSLPCAVKAKEPIVLPQATFANIGGPASVPFGWVDFCQRYQGECENPPARPRDLHLTHKALKKIQWINNFVNRSVTPVTDADHWHVLDQWDYPYDGKGDCEDFALYKRKLLIEAGFPRQGLLMSVVKDEHKEGHAILTLKTDRGEFVLDNLNDAITPWDQTGYRFVKRQSQFDENIWVQIGEPTPSPDYVSGR